MKATWKLLLVSCIVPFSIFSKPYAYGAEKKGAGATGPEHTSQVMYNTAVSYLRLQLSKDSTNREDIVIRFSNMAKAKYILDEDAPYMQGFGVLGMYSISADSIPLAINVLPLPGKSPAVIRLGILSKVSATFRLNLTDDVNVPQLFDVWLIDKYKNDSLNMRQSKTYSFDISRADTASFGTNRFALVIRQAPARAYQLLHFKAAKVSGAKQAQLSWKTTNEGNYTNFTVERSNNEGKTFEVVESIQGTGAGTYSLVDKSPQPGQNLYVLKQIDASNIITYSKVAPVSFSDQNDPSATYKLSIYPNPVVSTVNLAVISPPNDISAYNIKFMNGSGKVIKEISSGQPNWQGSMDNLRPGIYFIRVLNSKNSSLIGETKFVKL